MANIEEQVAEALMKFGKLFSKAAIIVEGIIVDVDEVKFTCTVNVQSIENINDKNNIYTSVPLKVLKGSQASLIEIPAKNSICTICFRDNNIQRPQLYQVDQCDKILIKVGNKADGFQTLQISKDGFVWNDGKNGGLVLAPELKMQSNKDKAILDALLSIINGTPINEPGSGSPSALQAALKGALTGKQSGTWNNLENKKLLQ